MGQPLWFTHSGDYIHKILNALCKNNVVLGVNAMQKPKMRIQIFQKHCFRSNQHH